MTETISVMNIKLPKSLNGAQEFLPSKSKISLELTISSLERLLDILNHYNYNAFIMLSMMTFSVEHFRSTAHVKQATIRQGVYESN